MITESPAFRQSRPVLLTTFTNKIGSIGLSLITILLVNRGVSTEKGTIVLSTLKITMLAGTLGAGLLSDRFNSRTLVLAALLMSTIGLGLLPFQTGIVAILFFGMLAQFAEALLTVVQRILLMDQVDFAHQKEALGWMRMVNNFAQIFSFSFAALGARFGLTPLMLFDSATSLSAFAIGRKILPHRDGPSESGKGLGADKVGGHASKWTFYCYALVLMGWAFFYELFLAGGAGRLEILHPGEGLRRFSTAMILNTILCAGFAVKATKFFHKPWIATIGGMLLTAFGTLLAVWGMTSQLWVYVGMLFLTFGELMVGAVSQYTLIRLTPGTSTAGFYYSLGMTLLLIGRILGAAAAFPLLVHASHLSPFIAFVFGVLILQLIVLWAIRGEVSRIS